jgi:hypothetical protein
MMGQVGQPILGPEVLARPTLVDHAMGVLGAHPIGDRVALDMTDQVVPLMTGQEVPHMQVRVAPAMRDPAAPAIPVRGVRASRVLQPASETWGKLSGRRTVSFHWLLKSCSVEFLSLRRRKSLTWLAAPRDRASRRASESSTLVPAQVARQHLKARVVCQAWHNRPDRL